jgi:hypothetical protein
MKIKYLCLIFFAVYGLVSCSKKIHPVTTAATVISNDTIAAKKAFIKRKPKESLPKVITVNDLSAKKTADGRYYYDLQGHRYWRNNKDGKYYLFNKTMYANEDFKPTSIL